MNLQFCGIHSGCYEYYHERNGRFRFLIGPEITAEFWIKKCDFLVSEFPKFAVSALSISFLFVFSMLYTPLIDLIIYIL